MRVMKYLIAACLAVAAAEWRDDDYEFSGYVLAARRRRREHVAATEFKAKVAPYLVEAPEL